MRDGRDHVDRIAKDRRCCKDSAPSSPARPAAAPPPRPGAPRFRSTAPGWRNSVLLHLGAMDGNMAQIHSLELAPSMSAPPTYVAVVDDDRSVCLSFARLLRAAGIQAITY